MKVKLLAASVAFCAITALFLCSCKTEPDTPGADGGDFILPETDARTINALQKLKNGEQITLVTIGGSITEGGQWSSIVSKWFEDKGQLNYVNSGIGSSDSGLGLLRTKDHVLRHNPDIVIVEYSVNDSYYFNARNNNRSYEGMVRQLLGNSDSAVFLLLLNTADQGEGKESNRAHTAQKAIGDNYAIPVFKWMDWEKTEDWKPLYRDGTHPNATGGASIAKGITAYLDKAWDSLPAEAVSIDKTLPAAKYFDDYENTVFISAGSSGVTPGGWIVGAKHPNSWAAMSDELKDTQGWYANGADSEIKIKFKGKSVFIVSSFDTKGSGYPGQSGAGGGQAWVEKSGGGETAKVRVASKSYWAEGGGTWEYFGTHIADGLDPAQEHTLIIKGAGDGEVNIWGVVVGVNP